MMKNKSFAAFILTHGRADRVLTYHALEKAGYTGRTHIIIDDEDPQEEQYRANFPSVIKFNKLSIAERYDTGDNFEDRRSIFYARNASFEIARDLGLKYFIQLDDDYRDFRYKFFREGGEIRFGDKNILSLDKVFDLLIDYYKKIPALSIAMAQCGDFIGGAISSSAKDGIKPKRKCMNTILCSTERPYSFTGRINEDVNTYTNLGSRGELFLTIPSVAIYQLATQSNPGGMSELYLDSGTYIKSFYSVMYSPSFVKITLMNSEHRRLHHQVSWEHGVPCIIREENKKIKEDERNKKETRTTSGRNRLG